MLQTSIFLKRLFLIAFMTVGAILLMCGCQTKVQIAPEQGNGLHYKFIDYIGPDSCKLYKCAYQGPEDDEASSVFMTVCDDKPSGIQWSVKHGKTTSTYNNTTVMTDTSSKYDFIDTVIKMMPKMMPDTCFIIRKKK